MAQFRVDASKFNYSRSALGDGDPSGPVEWEGGEFSGWLRWEQARTRSDT